jgi:arginase
MLKSIAVIEAPSILGLRPTGVEHLPDALVRAGLLGRLHARHAGHVKAPAYNATRDRETGFLNPRALQATHACWQSASMRCLTRAILLWCWRIADSAWVDAGPQPARPLWAAFPGRPYGFYDKESNINGEAASSELALVTGRGPALLTTYDGRSPWSEMKTSLRSDSGTKMRRSLRQSAAPGEDEGPQPWGGAAFGC